MQSSLAIGYGKSVIQHWNWGERGWFLPAIMILREKIVVLPTILSSGVWGAIPSIFDIQSCEVLHFISGASFGLENVFTKFSKNFYVVTSFYDVIKFFAMLPKIATKAQFGHHDILDIHWCATVKASTFILVQHTFDTILDLFEKKLEISNVMTSSDDVTNCLFWPFFCNIALITCLYVSVSFLI